MGPHDSERLKKRRSESGKGSGKGNDGSGGNTRNRLFRARW